MNGQQHAACDVSSESDVEVTLAVLNAVYENSELTQRSISEQLGIALGLVNAYLKRCVTKGFIKIRQVPRRRYAYYLTPTGFAEKRRLTAEYLRQSFKFIQAARCDCAGEFERCRERGWSRMVFFGLGDFADVALLCCRETGLDLVAVAAPNSGTAYYHGVPVVETLGEIKTGWDAVLITDVVDPQGAFDAVAGAYPADRVLTPAILGISRRRLQEMVD